MKYEVVRSKRKTAAIEIKPEGVVIVRIPSWYTKDMAAQFVNQHLDWINKKLTEQMKQQREVKKISLTDNERQAAIEKAVQLFPQRVAFYAKQMGVDYGRITIREQKTRWGSCSAKGNLNFNWRLILAPEEVLDYVVVHELAHRRHMNHSQEFYAFVAQTLPEYEQSRIWLRKYGSSIMQK